MQSPAQGSTMENSKRKPKTGRQAVVEASSEQVLINAPHNAEASSSRRSLPSLVPGEEGGEAGARQREKKRKHRRRDDSNAEQDVARGLAETEWVGIPLANNQVSTTPPIWTPDGRFYISVQGSSIMVDSASPPHSRLSTLFTTGKAVHQAPITALCLSPLDPHHILTASKDGSVRIWDIVAGRPIHAIYLDGPIAQMCVGEVGAEWQVFVTVSKRKLRKGKPGIDLSSSYRVQRFALVPNSTSSPEIHFLGKLSSPPTALFVSPSHTYLAALAGTKVYAFLLPSSPTSSNWSAQLVKFVSDQPLTCGSFAPLSKLSKINEEWFATGDEKGNIRLWHGLSQAFKLLSGGGKRDAGKALPEAEKRLPTTSLHWHAHAVAALAFTPSGSQLLSVGEESVLVQWHLGSGKREYIPRLGGRPIVSLAIKPGARGVEEEWWMAFKDGSVVKVGAASGRIETIGQGVKIDPLREISPSTPYPLALHPSSSSLVLPSSHPGTLQFIDPHRSAVVFDLEVAPSNRVSRRDDKELVPVAVESVAFSGPMEGQCEWMATVEGRDGDDWEGGGEVRNLKIWKWEIDRYIVNTQFPRPHGLAHITSLSFTPLTDAKSNKHPLLLTTAIDGTAKLWQVRQSRKSEHGKKAVKKSTAFETYWSPRSSWSYRSLPILSAATSPDGTLIALAHGSVVSLWETESNLFLRALGDDTITDISEIVFAAEDGQYLVASGKSGMICWDLLSCQVAWRDLQARTTRITRLQQGEIIAHRTVSSSTVISLLSPISSRPKREVRLSQPLCALQLLSASTTDASTSLSFAGVSTTGEVLRFGDRITEKAATAAALPEKLATKLSIWQEMFGEHAIISETAPDVSAANKAESRGRTITGRPSAVFDGPSHTLPPTSMLFDEFMDEIMALPAVDAEALIPAQEDEPILINTGGDASDANITQDMAAAHKQVNKVVGDAEVKELEGFFAALFSGKHDTSVASTGAPHGSGKKSKQTVHHRQADASKASKSTPAKAAALPNGTSTPHSGAKEGRVEGHTPNGNKNDATRGGPVSHPSSTPNANNAISATNGSASAQRKRSASSASSSAVSPKIALKGLVADKPVTPAQQKSVKYSVGGSEEDRRLGSTEGKKGKKRRAPQDDE